MKGRFEAGEDIAALRSFVGLTQEQFARAVGISVHTLRNWEQGRGNPEGPAIALLRIAARHPRIIRESLDSAAKRHRLFASTLVVVGSSGCAFSLWV